MTKLANSDFNGHLTDISGPQILQRISAVEPPSKFGPKTLFIEFPGALWRPRASILSQLPKNPFPVSAAEAKLLAG